MNDQIRVIYQQKELMPELYAASMKGFNLFETFWETKEKINLETVRLALEKFEQ